MGGEVLPPLVVRAAATADTHDEHTPTAEHVHMALAGDADLLDHDSVGGREDGPGSDDADSSRYARSGMASGVGRATGASHAAHFLFAKQFKKLVFYDLEAFSVRVMNAHGRPVCRYCLCLEGGSVFWF